MTVSQLVARQIIMLLFHVFSAPIPFRKKEKQEKEKDDLGPDRFSMPGTDLVLSSAQILLSVFKSC